MNNFALFAVGVVVSIPAAIVVITLVYAAGIDSRAQAKVREHSDGAPPDPL